MHGVKRRAATGNISTIFATNDKDTILKKGDLTMLKSWRPISLINCDARFLQAAQQASRLSY